MRVAKWGNSPGVRLPTAMIEALDLKKGDEIDSSLPKHGGSVWRGSPGATGLLKRLHAFRSRLPADFNFGRDGANAR
jgi:antitoxin MazE